MKKAVKKIMSVLLAGTMLVTPVTASAFTGSSNFMDKTYTHQDRFAAGSIQQGIDVSYHNGNLNWSTIKAAGVDFAILRAAYRGYGDEGTLVKDTKFAEYISGAQSQGIPVGAYIYSQAVSTAEAVEEANYILNIVKGYSLNLPIVFDYEFAGVKTGRLDSAWSSGKLNKSKMTNIALAFCNTIKNAGYDAMVYANKSFLNTNLDHEAIEDAGYEVWLAHYTTSTDYTGEYKIWQYTSSGTIPGISNKVFDCNFMYSGLNVANIPNQVYSGYEITPSINVSYGGTTLTEGIDYTVTYQNNTAIGTATVNILGAGNYENVIKLTRTFNIIPGTVQNMQASDVKTNCANLSWSAVDGASGYTVQVLKNNKWTTVGNYTGTNAQISGLLTGSINYVNIAAYASINGKNYTGAYNTALKIETAVGAVNPKVSAYADSYIKLTWDKQTAANGYEVYKYNSSTKKYALYKSITNANTNTCKVTGLSANKKYYFKVRAYQIDGSEKTYASFGTIISQYTSVTKPTLKSAKSSSKKKIKASWAKVSGASGYQVMWSTYSDFSKNYKTKSVTSKYLSKTVTTAQSKKYYYVRVRAYKKISGKKIYSPWSKTKKLKTK